MLSGTTKAVSHFNKWVPCCEGRVISHADDPARLVRVNSEKEAEILADQYSDSLYDNKPCPNGYQAGDSYMLSQHPVTAL